MSNLKFQNLDTTLSHLKASRRHLDHARESLLNCTTLRMSHRLKLLEELHRARFRLGHVLNKAQSHRRQQLKKLVLTQVSADP